MFRLSISRIVNSKVISPPSNVRNIVTASRYSSFGNRSWKACLSLSPCRTGIDSTITRISPIFAAKRSINSAASEEIVENPPNTESAQATLARLEKVFDRYESICQGIMRVNVANFVRTFDTFTKYVALMEADNVLTDEVRSNLSLHGAVMIRSCGNLMVDARDKERELLVGNVWHFLKEKKIPLDISHYNGLIRVLNENKANYDPQKILTEILDANLTPDRMTYQRLIHQYCLQGKVNEATDLLNKMKELGLGLNEDLFASLILGYGQQENPPSIIEMFDLMKSHDINPRGKSFAAAIATAAKRLATNSQAATAELEKLYNMIVKDDIDFSNEDIEEIIPILAANKSNEAVAKLWDHISSSLRRFNNMEYRVTSVLLKAGEYEEASKRFWSIPVDNRVKNNGHYGDNYMRLLSMIHGAHSTDFVISECAKLKELGYNYKAFHHMYYYACLNKRYDLIRATLDKIKETDEVSCQYYWPLIVQAKDKDTFIKALKDNFNSEMNNSDLIETFSLWVWPRYKDNAQELFDLNKKELKFDAQTLLMSFIQYGVLANKLPDIAEQIMKMELEMIDQAESQQPSADEEKAEPAVANVRRRARKNDVRDTVGASRVLNLIAEQTMDPQVVEKVFNLCYSTRKFVPNLSLNAMIKAYLLKGDFAGAVDKFAELSSKYRVTPAKRDLLNHCVVNQDPVNLQKIMDISIDIHNEDNSLYDLAVLCMKNDKMSQAKKIFSSGLRVREYRIFETMKTMMKYDSIETLEDFVELAKNVQDVDQEKLYTTLIRHYERIGNVERVLNLWTKMQEDQFPNKRRMILIAEALERHNLPVPFKKPQL